MSKKILFIIGSIRKGSFNRQLAEQIKGLLGDRAEVRFLSYTDIPYMNQDIEFPAPASIVRVRKEVEDADAVWIFTPEYNHQIPGVLKNLLDWLSRTYVPNNFGGETAAAGKPVTVSAAAGKMAASGCREQLGILLEFMRMKQMREHETGIALSKESFVTGKLLLSEEEKAQLAKQAEAFLEFIGNC